MNSLSEVTLLLRLYAESCPSKYSKRELCSCPCMCVFIKTLNEPYPPHLEAGRAQGASLSARWLAMAVSMSSAGPKPIAMARGDRVHSHTDDRHEEPSFFRLAQCIH